MKEIYDALKKAGLCDNGIFGLMGNLKAESNFKSTNLQNTYEKSLGMNDAEYTKRVDSGEYINFVRDSAGYGLAQWTYWTRKQKLLNYARHTGRSIGDKLMQVEFMIQELKGYPSVWKVLLDADTIKQASDIVLTLYERPANQSDSVKRTRAKYGEQIKKQLFPETTAVEIDIDAIAREVIQGKWGNGNARKEQLTKAGYDYRTIQKRVNEMLK